jgi:hypothetical protein
MPEPPGNVEAAPESESDTTAGSPSGVAPEEAVGRVPAFRPRQPAAPATVQKAIDEVNHIIRTLREATDDMEEILETLELAERQKDADEREIESLRRALRPLHRHGEGGQGRRERA